jgi:uncharacterized protein YgiM (DUF1202 family)
MKHSSGSLLQALGGILLVALTAACTGSVMDEAAFKAALDTAVAGTVTAQALDVQRTKGAEAAQPATATLEPTATNTAIPDSPTAEPTTTETPEMAGEVEVTPPPQFTLSGPSVQVSIDTNCRSGPGVAYNIIGALMVGEEATVAGKDPSGSYWYIENPDQEEAFCWIWGKYATTSGNASLVPVYTPGPTPSPEVLFSVGYREVESCAGAWQVEFEIVNTGRFNLESVSTRVEDTVTSAASGKLTSNYFVRKTGCAVDQNKETLAPGVTGFSVTNNLSNDPTGHLVYASVTVCTEDFLNGECRTREFYFTP